MKISIIIPTYKPKDYIYECLNSLESQTLNQKDFEVLLILNGTKNPYYENILHFIQNKKIKNIRLIYIEENGVSNARNVGLDEARGDYISFVDDDDYIDEDYLETMLCSIQSKKFYICCTNYKNFYDDNIMVFNYDQYPWNSESSSIITYRKVFSSIGAKIIPRYIIGNIRFNTSLNNSEDALFMSTISKNIQGIKIAQKESYYHRRIRLNSSNFKKKNILYILRNMSFLIKCHLKLLIDKNYNKEFLILRILAVIKGVIFQVKNSFKLKYNYK